MAILNVGRLLRFVGNFDLVHFLRGVELAVHAVDRIARDLHSIDMRLEALCLMRATDVLYSARLVSASGALSSKAQELSDLRCQVARQTLEMSGFREPE